jgi:acyl transferase domain-containing protein/NAD(P)H-dependent flavin oxidoreductase YrpB (nitropropane dioxygenase family)/NAD(P)-dependent dehydrogenase (short-subunit alcohol dehydrogenase family)/acyl carrier protein
MARISDVPEFLNDVADEGALPFLALSMMQGASATQVMTETKAMLGDKPWGVGILGFAYPKLLEEQTKLILEHKPPYVLIAGGRPMQGRTFEQAGIKALIHVPSPGLLDMFLKENWKSYIFEGRESGGHVGPLFSLVLWEKQINRLLHVDKPSEISVYFAGGIHDANSAAFVRLMAAPIAARGVKIGLVCGTAYLYTEEAVKSGAITATYQREIINKNETLLLKSGNGQETRSVSSPFTDFFLAEKERMTAEGMEINEILMKLEELNLGRLRIAAKGLERVDGEVVMLTEEAQLEKGLYMTGEVTTLHDRTTTIAALHESIITDSQKLLSTIEASDEEKISKSVDVAVIGMSGIFPDAADLDEFWRNIVFGRDSITEVPAERWPVDLFYDPNAKDTDHVVSKWGGFIDKVDFDALEFGITPQSLAAIEPVQLLSLLVAKRALEDAGFTDLSEADLDDTSVIFGAQGAGELAGAYGSRAGMKQMLGELPEELAESLPYLTEDSFPGVLGNVIAGRISNRLNTGGRNFTVDAACASSLAGLDVALSELENKKSDMVILGGADLHNGLFDYLMFSSTHALSKNGRCSTFDERADGITLGEGVGVLILKRLEDAKRDGNKIYAVIKGIGASSDGKSLGLTAPGKRGQMRALEQAYEVTGIRPSDVGLIEAHGTGTSVGDRTELKALTDIFLEDGARQGQTVLGSVKTNIGHTKCAAGVAGLFKIINSVRYGILPPTLNLTKPNEVYNEMSPFAFRTEKAGYWHEKRRIAGVSGFGFGGTNFHAVVENYDEARHEMPLKAWMSELFVFAGETKDEALALFDKVEALYDINNSLRVRDLAYTLAKKASELPIQYVIVASDWAQLLGRMEDARAEIVNENIHIRHEVPGKVAFLFPGQGSQRVNMAADLFMNFPKMRELLNEAIEYEDILFPPTVFTSEEKQAQKATITDTKNAQPLLGIVDLAIANLLEEFGITPDMVAGHSYGELPALSFAGAIPKEKLVHLSCARAEAMMTSPGASIGRMTAVFTDSDTIDSLLASETELWAVNYNAPRQTVVAGSAEAMSAFLEKLDAEKIAYKALNVSSAFHSPLLAGADSMFAKALDAVEIDKPNIPVWSNTNAALYPETAVGIKARLAEHLINAVHFTDEIKAMKEAGASVYIEVGPGNTLTGLVSETLKNQEIVVIQTEKDNAEGLTLLLQGIAKYVATGRSINMDKLFENRDAKELNLDDPSEHTKNATVWNINGQRAVPENGELPAHAGKPTAGSVMLTDQLKKNLYMNANSEQIMMAYLDNMNALIQDQRDVMLGYLGSGDAIPRREATGRQFTITGQTQVEALPQPVATVAPSEPAVKVEGLLNLEDLTPEKIQEIIYDIVSEKTGYPTDMFDLEMDLESDLSIDSIKKMEIIGALSDKINTPTSADDVSEEEKTLLFEQIISIKTFQDVIDWLNGAGQETSQEEEGFAGASIAVEIKDTGNEADSKDIIRMTLVKTPFAIETTDPTVLEGKTFAITDDGQGLAVRVNEALTELGAIGRIVTVDSDNLTDCDGLVFIHSVAGTNSNTMMDLFNLLKDADMDKLQSIFVFDDGLSQELAADANLPQGFAGFIKALVHEYPKHRLASIQFETPIDTETFANIVTSELTTNETMVELFYADEERFLSVPTINALEATADAKSLPLNADSVVVVLGGAQGITPHVIHRMAKDNPCHYVLLGRSEMKESDAEYAAFETIEDIQKQLIEQKVLTKPKEIQAEAMRIFKSSGINKALTKIEETGAQVTYMSVDVTNREAFTSTLAEIKKAHGHIDGLVHAAGILEDKLFRSKEADSFTRVYNTKVNPLQTVIANLLPELKLLVLFSSMSSAFGNAGQCDYSAGNCVLDQTAAMLKRQYPDLQVAAFDWGPWKGAGMVNAGLEQEFRKRGIWFVELEKGAEFLMNELAHADEASVLAIAGDAELTADFIATIYPKV